MKLNLRLSHKALILIAVPLLFEMVFVGAMTWLYLSAEQESYNDMQAKEIIAVANTIAAQTEQAFSSLYMYNKAPDPAVLKRYNEKMVEIKGSIQSLQEWTHDRPKEFEIAQKASDAFKQGEALGDYVLNAIQKGESLEDKDRKLKGEAPLRFRVIRIFQNLMHLVHRLGQLEEDRSNEMSKRKYRDLVVPLLGVGVLVNVLLAIALALFFNAGTSKRLRVLMDNSDRLARGADLSARLSGGDEIAELDKVFHQMAEVLREAMIRERAVIANAVDVICTVDEKLFFKTLSPSAKDVFGQPPEDLVGLRLAALLVPEDCEQATMDFERVRTEADMPFFENRLKRGDEYVDVRWSVHWSESEKSYYCVVSDITARREIERLKQEFVSMMSHDLRTPLMSIQASLSILSAGAAGELSTTAKRNVGDAERNIAYIISLINSLIDVERMDSAKLQVHPSATELLPLIEAAVQAVRSLAANKGIAVTYAKVDPDLEVNADGDRVVQVLINLMSNALKFSSKGTTILVDASLQTDHVLLKVIDEGRGIPSAQLSSVFERFKQVQESDATHHKGSGLGLAICKSIVESHGCTIGVESTEGKGTTFWFTLPLVKESLAGTTDGGIDQGAVSSIL